MCLNLTMDKIFVTNIQNQVRQDFLWTVLQLFFQFFGAISEISFGWPARNSDLISNIVQVFLNVPNSLTSQGFKLICNSCGNSYIRFLVIFI